MEQSPPTWILTGDEWAFNVYRASDSSSTSGLLSYQHVSTGAQSRQVKHWLASIGECEAKGVLLLDFLFSLLIQFRVTET